MPYVVDTVTGRILILVRKLGRDDEGARLRTLDGNTWVKRLRQLRAPMAGEIRAADRHLAITRAA